LSALLGLPGSTVEQPAGDEYTYANNPFRGANVAPTAGNIQWDMFSNGKADLVRMLVNEKQARLKAGCAPIERGSYYYSLNELESCYGWSPAAS
jgi:hypothetical protein